MSLAQGNNTPTRPRIEPGSPDPESDALTTRPVRSPRKLLAKFNETGSAERIDVYHVNVSSKLKPELRVYNMTNNSRSLLDDSSFLIEQKFSHNLVMVGSSGLGGTLSNQVGCWQTNLKLSYITKTHRVHGSRLLLLKGKYAKTSFDELSWKYILNESRRFSAYNHFFV